MVKKKLVEELVSDGAKLLRALDHRNFPVESMFWIHVPEEDYWRLIISSAAVKQEGAAAAYRNVGTIIRGLDLAGLTLEDISLLDPESSRFHTLWSQVSGYSKLASAPFWFELEDALIYRWTGAMIEGELSCDLTLSQLEEFWDDERRKSNLPALLFDMNGRRFTLRFHPQHGPLGGINEIKSSFAIALHRPDARPDCQIVWLK